MYIYIYNLSNQLYIIRISKNTENAPLNNPHATITSVILLFAFKPSNQTFLQQKTVQVIYQAFAQLVVTSLYFVWEGIRVQGFKFFRWLITFPFKQQQRGINQHQSIESSPDGLILWSRPCQVARRQEPPPCFQQKNISLFCWENFQYSYLLSLAKTFLRYFRGRNHFHPPNFVSSIKNQRKIYLSHILCLAHLLREITNESQYQRSGGYWRVESLMSINVNWPHDKNCMLKLLFLDYNLKMISKKKEIQENLLQFNSKQVLHLSTAQEKDSHSNARPFQHTFSQIVEENCEEEPLTPQNSYCHFLEESGSESNTSFQKKLTFEHLACLEANIEEISKHVLKVPKSLDLTKLCDYEFQDNQQTFGTFVQGPRSPIPPSQRPQFLSLLKQNFCLRKVIMWIYGHVQSQLSDELILIAHRIALAYHPIKAFVTGAAGWQKLADLEFNIWNAYNDPTLKLLHYSQLLQLQQGGLFFDAHLHQFFRFYLVTILLVLQEYFENPDYGNILGLKLYPNNKSSMARHKKPSRLKIIRKKEKPRP